MNTIEVITLRHAQPDQRFSTVDPDLLLGHGLEQAVTGAVQRIQELTPDVENYAFFASPTKRALSTARCLVDSGHFDNQTSRLGVLTHQVLEEGATDRVPVARKEQHWRSALGSLARLAVSESSEETPSAMILVSHAPVIKEILTTLPEAKLGHPQYINFLDARKFTFAFEPIPAPAQA